MKIGMYLYKTNYLRYGEDRYKKMKEHGFDCVDFNMDDTSSPIYTLSEAESDALMLREKALAEEAGMEINQVHGPWRYPPRDLEPEDRAERLESMKRSIRATAALGCKHWVIHPIMPYTTHDTEHGKEKETWEMNVEFFRALLPTAKEYGITVCLENMPMLAFSLSKPADILRLVEEINDESFKVCLDTGHVSVFKELNIGDEVRRLGDYIKVLHVHDNMMSRDLHLLPYFGDLDWDGFLKALKDIGYKGVFSLETAPPEALPMPIFEKMSISLAGLARGMVKEL